MQIRTVKDASGRPISYSNQSRYARYEVNNYLKNVDKPDESICIQAEISDGPRKILNDRFYAAITNNGLDLKYRVGDSTTLNAKLKIPAALTVKLSNDDRTINVSLNENTKPLLLRQFVGSVSSEIDNLIIEANKGNDGAAADITRAFALKASEDSAKAGETARKLVAPLFQIIAV